jgi:hypothetical protein
LGIREDVHVSDAYALLRKAVREKLQVVAEYDGRQREFCPHVLGTKNGRRRCLAYQFAAEHTSGAVERDAQSWRCFDVDRITIVEVRTGLWLPDSEHTRGQTCVDEVDVNAERPAPTFTLIQGFRRD